jgi:hypothetical protein
MSERQMKEANRQKSTTASTEKTVFQEAALFLLCLLCMCAARLAARGVLLRKKKTPFICDLFDFLE